jgi:hypothetical protein
MFLPVETPASVKINTKISSEFNIELEMPLSQKNLAYSNELF